MSKQDINIDEIARAFIEVAAALGNAMSDQLEEAAPGSSAQVGEAMARGARVLIALELSATDPAVSMVMIDDDKYADVIMSITGKNVVRH